MKTMDKELVKIIDKCDSYALEIFSSCSQYQYLLEQHIQNILRLNKKL